jgi:lipopolysaccharide export system protein LptA
MKDIEYLSKDNNGNQYKINSSFGQIDDKNQDLILMTNVKAIISLSNKEKILIFSDFARYNSKNYETDFYDNVKLNYISHNIQAQKLNLSFENNLVSMSDNIIYKNLDTNIIADKLEINLLNKETKVFMRDSNQKIKILTKR